MELLFIIPARGGSKGIPRKNIKLLNGKPLIQYTIEAARQLIDDTKIIVSTEDEEIKSIVENIGLKVPFLRPAHLASDTSGTYEVLLHVVNQVHKGGYHPKSIVVLQATSPFRTANQIKEALKVYEATPDCDMLVSVKETKSNPYYLLFEEDEGGYLKKSKQANFVRRQDCPKVWELNGAIYIIKVEALVAKAMSQFDKIIKYEMDEYSSLDIDSPLDWKIAACIMEDSNSI